uniref:Ribbon-helix-helix domain-containing protein n=1 Tax=Fervidicoccus fontis TaxID=683846 RepID=A0A7J3ZJW2_9CREN
MGKKRFGVSVSSSLYALLEDAARHYGVTLSQIVEEALGEYLSRLAHGREEHWCKAVLVAIAKGREEHDLIERAVGEHGAAARSMLHSHVGELCVFFAYLEESSSSINSLLSTLKRGRIQHVFAPIEHQAGGREALRRGPLSSRVS